MGCVRITPTEWVYCNS